MCSAWCPRSSPSADASLSSTGSSGASSPASTVISKRYDFLPLIPPRFVTFAWRYLSAHSLDSLFGGQVHRRSPELVTRCLQPGQLPRKWQDLTSSWRTPIVHSPCSVDAGRTADTRPFCGAAAWPLVWEQQRLPRKVFRRSIDGFWTGCLRFAVRVAHAPRKTRFRPLVRRYRTGFPPAGFRRKVSELFPTSSHPPFPSFLSQSHRPE
jgi:hypothetical protein